MEFAWEHSPHQARLLFPGQGGLSSPGLQLRKGAFVCQVLPWGQGEGC